MTKTILKTAMLGLGLVALPLAASAGHSHYVSTPGTTVSDVGSGQTSISDEDHGGYHRFHDNVHLGTPGQEATTNERNPVEIGKN